MLGRFSALSLFAMIALGLTIGFVLQARIQARALREAEQLTSVVSGLAIAPDLSSGELVDWLAGRRPAPAQPA